MTASLFSLVVHADWGASPAKRWMAWARLRKDGRYEACAPAPVGELGTLLARMREEAGAGGCALVGFDFPIGLSRHFAERVGIRDFLALLPQLGHGDWSEFFVVAEHPEQVSLRRPFYPQHSREKGQARLQHLLDGLGLDAADDLRRQCEKARAGRRAAAPLFWTVGGQQVGKAAISGWRDVLGPALRSNTGNVALWPFSGPLFELIRAGCVVAETYPAEFYTHLGITFPAHRAGQRSGKRVQLDRANSAAALQKWTRFAGVKLAPDLRATIADGFGSAADGEDRFDAAVGLLGMLNVVLGHRLPGEPQDRTIGSVEGWILGQADGG